MGRTTKPPGAVERKKKGGLKKRLKHVRRKKVKGKNKRKGGRRGTPETPERKACNRMERQAETKGDRLMEIESVEGPRP